MVVDKIKMVQSWKNNVLLFSMIPVLLLGDILISHGNAFETDFFTLFNLLEGFESLQVLPKVAAQIGWNCVIALFVGFILWLALFSILCYWKLSKQIAGKMELLLELALISVTYFYFISPTSMAGYVSGIILISCDLLLIILYAIYDLKVRHEER